MIAIGGTIRFPPENLDQVREILATFVQASRAEPGNLAYYGALDLVEAGMITIFEVYVDEPALEAHRGSAHMAAWREAGGPLGVGQRELYLYDIGGREKL